MSVGGSGGCGREWWVWEGVVSVGGSGEWEGVVSVGGSGECGR